MQVRAISLLLLIFSCSVSATAIMTRTVSRDDGSFISYYLVQHAHDTDTLLLILQGSDCNSVLNIDSILTEYKNVWPEADVLLIEKYGINRKLKYSTDPARKDCPAQYLEKDNPAQRVADINTVLDIVRKDGQYKKLIQLGGSEGAVIANLVSADIDSIDATIAFNGGGRWFIDDVSHSIEVKHKNPEAARKEVDDFKEFAEHVLHSKPFELEVSGHGYHWWQQMLSLDQLDTLQNVKSPLLIVQGGRDTSVSPQKTDELWQRLKDLGKNNIEYRRYEKLDHGLKDSDGKNLRKEVVSDMNMWLKSKLGNPTNNPASAD
ncbi:MULTISPECIES: alpha/beta hydrolase family protein [Aeromonas]|jgi:pimeloyl-ACP methyl ester carboxylesterase|uniref:alpha/beta hydrolase family protein n=1 Tax=Aeromonas TaxID=642 RepID=UPI001C2163DB|nr:MULTISPECIES: prolyl oligopeptidase family serine peptidase [Aeromonas]MCR3937231.1 prolyl oligopeptidase family serine peptidase [Aeromonas caviae]MCR3945642.1 prolyl oligopeptidase family serine peptidase [Aeromonas caviae]MEA9421490.1 prolyl oligopeptidase family serine peptidase [Aeromonas caviae]MEA9426410.1 prolyl oligopeptidase family serine peptidase [Aeromonas caviae]MEA9433197.1 prolyl oligopeptidase family serine peptidase [Aeromonas caviae]